MTGTALPSSTRQGSPVGAEHGHWITAVQAGQSFSLFFNSGYAYGPKARDIRDWVITNL